MLDKRCRFNLKTKGQNKAREMVGYKYILHREQGSRRGEENDWTFQSIGADEQTWLTYVSVKKKKINIKVLNFNCLKPKEKKEKK